MDVPVIWQIIVAWLWFEQSQNSRGTPEVLGRHPDRVIAEGSSAQMCAAGGLMSSRGEGGCHPLTWTTLEHD